jgi:hypothetical protein
VSDEKVVEFRIRRRELSDDAPLERLARAPRSDCPHPKFLIDEKQRTVQCGACGRWLDPVWCLMRFMERDEAVERRIQQLRELEAAAKARQERAIKRRQAESRRSELHAAAANCQACDGTGWIFVIDADNVRRSKRCECRKRQARLV